MWRAALVSLALLVPGAAHAQQETLADIRQELSVLYVELQRLRGELNTTGAPSGSGGGGSVLSRVDAIEAELRRLTSATEELELRIDRVVSDGTTRVGDLEFRLCELESDCDISTLDETSTLGGGDSAGLAPAPAPTTTSPGTSMAAAEQSDFDRAMAAYEEGDFASAATQFEAYTETYPGGALSAEAHFWRGEAEAAQGAWNRAARAYLASFSGSPEAPRAPESLYRLGTSLQELGQSDEACLTLGEVERRYPDSPSVLDARAAMTRFGCN
ncbi:tol-pal system protein YbgF [Alterinioella nitratireducens]|jgi:tol-pal system protein YbgF|uniref:tol-pal system protein YbgF n=1 Tax=Alterinioella nitratireducens TaxID=2735915 RepID=UPI000C5F39FB|nr:tol-pal system protein YbgF [Dinoroseobacter sp.]MAX72434.1 tol-pal system protein YbgF [Nioella sp.]